jgi:hypothetical protein
MKKLDISRRDFLRGTAATTVVAATVFATKEITEAKYAEAKMDDLEVVKEQPQFSCLDYLKSLQNQ